MRLPGSGRLAATAVAVLLASAAAPSRSVPVDPPLGAGGLRHPAASPDTTGGSHPPLAIVDVTVLPTGDARGLAGRTVLIRDGRIEAVGAVDSVAVPPDARVVDGAGRFLVPGLIDMHVHPQAALPVLRRLALHGLTTVRVMNGVEGHLRLRDSIRAGDLLAPDMVVAGPILEGPAAPGFEHLVRRYPHGVVTSREEGAEAVRRQVAAGYDLIKVYNNLSGDTYAGILEAARGRGVDVVGHVPFEAGLAAALAGQRTIEHLRGYVQEVVPDTAAVRPGPDYRSRLLSWAEADTTRFAALARATAEAGVWNCPTLSVRAFYLPTPELAAYLSSPAAASLSEPQRAWLVRRQNAPYFRNVEEDDLPVISAGYLRTDALLRALRDAGAPICAGTDVPAHGEELLAELQRLVAAGLTPAEAFDAATTSAADALRREDLGRVVAGARADLLLLDGHPHDGLTSLARPAGLALRGRWLPRPTLDSLLAIEAARVRRVVRVTDLGGSGGRTLAAGRTPLAAAEGTVYYLSDRPETRRYVAAPQPIGVDRLVETMPLFALDLDGSEPRRVAEAVIVPHLHRTYDVDRSGRRLVYVGVRPEGSTEIRVRDLESGRESVLHAMSRPSPVGPRFSPDGTRVAFTDGPDLLIVSTAGGAPRSLASLAGWDGQVEWSADGREVMATGYPPERMNAVFIAPTEGGELRRITDDEHYKEGFAWDRAGSRVAYLCYCETDHLRVAALDGSGSEVLLAREDSWDWMGTWAPDGRYFFLGYGDRNGLFSLDPGTGRVEFVDEAAELPSFVRGRPLMVFGAGGG